MTDEQAIDDLEAEGSDAQIEEAFRQARQNPEFPDLDSDEEREVEEVARGCNEIYRFESEIRQEKGEPRLSRGEFFSAAKEMTKNISDDAFDGLDADAAFDEIKEKPDFAGWDENAAGEVIGAIEEAEDYMRGPKNGKKGGKKDGKKGGDKKQGGGDDDKQGGDRNGEQKPREEKNAQHRRPTPQ